MSLKEQKLFFTRNGEFTVWEKLNALSLPLLEKLYFFVFEKKYIGDFYPADNEFSSFLYRAFEALEESKENQGIFELEINNTFSEIITPRCDFNALIYHVSGTMLDIESSRLNLEELNKHDFEIDGLEMEYWYYPEKDIVDVRFTSEKSSYFKENNNLQYLHTELRVYLGFNIVLMTNFSQYTHTDTEKNKFIKSIIVSVSSSRNTVIAPIKLSDHSLRKLIVMEDQNLPAKLKFQIEGRFKVDIDISHDVNVRDLISQEEIKYFYDKYPLSLIRVKIRDDADKLMSLDGNEGKMYSRSQNLDPEDIDEFIEKINILLAYDYLNVNYRNEIGRLAYYHIVGSDQLKDNIVSTIYKDIEKYILSETLDYTGVFVKLLSNSFFFCLKDKKILSSVMPIDLLEKFDGRMINYLQKITNVKINEIGGILAHLLDLYKENLDDVSKLTIAIDDSISTVTELIRNASGQ
ncbi:hypothetical protein [Paenibacillus macquariensis]|uniref:Uncharacterized protein n=1 Tax=Paenibacillus macquariensis TaxID=948756 RepID=A0ABY1JK91_9BACL|nr:hypothetical protein [Paenibacillus macquariensis]MEC0089882.1 hypothetical protein [Paenibacillus macquariensis]OAB30656.1 hypothetical protein PMSM_21130 [Paenibacillus macquariensis subsp. macquariensis]SIQ33422.1 hypothetical protein SAMN05421578_101266 [Paenibacillus macquariensis]